ncbi:MAG: chorismate-binding protein, partial [Myxococcota bacterium]
VRLNVAIRTITLTEHPGGRTLHPGAFEDAELCLPVGAGIVADSTPDAEWAETLDKARFFTSLPAVAGVAP